MRGLNHHEDKKRNQKILHVANFIKENSLVGGGPKFKRDRVTSLSISTEEKVLVKNYGSNYDK